jgi:hypothetical protein
VLSEHDIWLDDLEWRTMRELSSSYLDEGRFLPFLGYEWTAPPERGGHADDDVVVVPHAHAPGDWRRSDPAIERLVEIASTHGTFELFGNRYLEQGWQVGFIGSTDNHHGHPGYPDTGTTFHTERNGLAAVLAPALTRDALFAAMRDLEAYATSGERILLEATLDGEPIGTRLPAAAERRVSARVSGTAPIEAIDIIKNGTVAFRKSYLSAPLTAESWVRLAFASSADIEGRSRAGAPTSSCCVWRERRATPRCASVSRRAGSDRRAPRRPRFRPRTSRSVSPRSKAARAFDRWPRRSTAHAHGRARSGSAVSRARTSRRPMPQEKSGACASQSRRSGPVPPRHAHSGHSTRTPTPRASAARLRRLARANSAGVRLRPFLIVVSAPLLSRSSMASTASASTA